MNTLNQQIEKTKKKLAELESKQHKIKTIIINNVEYELKQHDNNKLLSEIRIPKGWRLLLLSEVMMLYERGLIDTSFWIYVKQTNKEKEKKGRVARCIACSVGAYLYCYRNPSNSNASLGVMLCRDLKANKSKLKIK